MLPDASVLARRGGEYELMLSKRIGSTSTAAHTAAIANRTVAASSLSSALAAGSESLDAADALYLPPYRAGLPQSVLKENRDVDEGALL